MQIGRKAEKGNLHMLWKGETSIQKYIFWARQQNTANIYQTSIRISNMQNQQQENQPRPNRLQEILPEEQRIDDLNLDVNPQTMPLFQSSFQPSLTSYPFGSLPQQQIIIDDENDGFSLASESRSRRRKRRNKQQIKVLEIDSKEESVEEVRQYRNQPQTIVLQPMEIPTGYAIDLDQQRGDSHAAIDPSISALPNHIIDKMVQQVHPDLRLSTFSRLIGQKRGEMPQLLQQSVLQAQQQQQHMQFQNLFDSFNAGLTLEQQNQQKVNFLIQQLQNTRISEDQVMILPKDIGEIVASKVLPLASFSQKQRFICQQFLMITMGDLINWNDIKLDLRNLIRSNYKQQICQFIQARLKMMDLTYNYHNVEVLRSINSRWIWDNVIPYMNETIYKFYSILSIRLLPQRCNGYPVTISKHHVFILLCQMFMGVLPRQIPTYDLPITFGQIMTIGQNDSVLLIENKKNKLRCLLHYFAAVLRDKDKSIESCGEYFVFERYRFGIKQQIFSSLDQKDRIRYQNLRVTDHLEVDIVREGEREKDIMIYLSHQNVCREAGEDNLETAYLMQPTYRLMYIKPQLFVLKGLTPKLDLGEAVIVHGLEQFSSAQWKIDQTNRRNIDFPHEEYFQQQFVCQGLFRQAARIDEYGKRRGSIILILSKLLFSQSFIKNDHLFNTKITQRYTLPQIKSEIETIYSALQATKLYPSQGNDGDSLERIVLSEKNIKFIQEDVKWMYFIICIVAASLARHRLVFEFGKVEDRIQAHHLRRLLKGWRIGEVITMLMEYREDMIEGYEGWTREVQRRNQLLSQEHDWNMGEGCLGENQQMLRRPRLFRMTLLAYIKEFY